MADNPFDITPIGFLEKPVSSDHNQNASQEQRTLRDLMKAMCGIRTANSSPASKAISGFIGDGFRIVPSSPAALSFQVTPGYGFIQSPADVPTNIGSPDILDLDDLSTFKPVVLLSPVTFNLVVPSAGNSRIDIVEVKVDRRLENLTARRKFDAVTEGFAAKSYFKTLAFGLDGRTGQVASPASSTAGLSYKVGVEGPAPVAPSTTPGYVKIAEIRSASGTVTVTGSLISDVRSLHSPLGNVMASIRYRLLWNGGAPTATIHSINAPPGVEMGVRPLTAIQGGSSIAIIGGNITHGAIAGLAIEHTQVGALNIHPRVKDASFGGGTGGFFATIASAEQANLAAMTPPILTGFATTRLWMTLESMFEDAAGVLSTANAALNDITVHASFMLGYH